MNIYNNDDGKGFSVIILVYSFTNMVDDFLSPPEHQILVYSLIFVSLEIVIISHDLNVLFLQLLMNLRILSTLPPFFCRGEVEFCIVQANLELAMLSRLSLNSRSSYFSFLSAGVQASAAMPVLSCQNFFLLISVPVVAEVIFFLEFFYLFLTDCQKFYMCF